MKKKYKLIRGAILGVAIASSTPTIVQAQNNGVNISNASSFLRENAKELFDGLVDWSANVDEKINEHVVDPIKEKISSTSLFEKDSLWLIEKKGALTEEEIHYFFVYKDASYDKTYYYDIYHNEVAKDSPEVTFTFTKEMYFSVTNLAADSFLKLIYEDRRGGVNYVNFTDMIDNEETLSVSNGKVGDFEKQYVRYQDWQQMFNLDIQNEKISIDELNECLAILEENYQKEHSDLVRRR